jgi:hypothetical protein
MFVCNVAWPQRTEYDTEDSIEWFIEDQAGDGKIANPFYSVGSTGSATHRKTEKEGQLADCSWGEGVGEKPNHTTARKVGPL